VINGWAEANIQVRGLFYGSTTLFFELNGLELIWADDRCAIGTGLDRR